jgi:HEAT repeat protein
MSTLTLAAQGCRPSDFPRTYSPTGARLMQLEKQSRQGESVRAVPPPFDVLSDEATRAVARWVRPCEAMFEVLAARFPFDLVKLIEKDGLAPTDLTFAAEALGRSNVSWQVRHTLKPLLDHESAVVREGAIYGLQRHLDDDLRERLAKIAKDDPRAGVRTAAEDALAEP